MSSFVVKNETIAEIVSYLSTQKNSPYNVVDRLLTRAGYNLENKTGREKLARDIQALNVRAVMERYSDERKEWHPFYYIETVPPSNIQAYRFLDQLLYQLAEGTVPQTDLYTLLDDIRGSIGREIIYNLPKYKQARDV